MPVVTFDHGAYLHDAEALDDYIAVASRRAPNHDRAPIGEVAVTTSGRRIWTSAPGVAETIGVSFRTRDRDIRLWVERRDGALVVYRDKRGRVEDAVLRNVSVTDLDSGLYDISMTVVPVDHTHAAVVVS